MEDPLVDAVRALIQKRDFVRAVSVAADALHDRQRAGIIFKRTKIHLIYDEAFIANYSLFGDATRTESALNIL